MGNHSSNGGEVLLLEQYKLYVEMADRLSARRIDASKFYTSLLTALLAVPFIVFGQGLSIPVQRIALLSIGILGAALCIIWTVNINSYKRLASLKFKVIHEMEQDLSFRCYEREWQILNADKHKYRRLSEVERLVPVLFGMLFVATIMVVVITAFST